MFLVLFLRFFWQVDLGRDYVVTAVATQGRDGFDQWVTSFALFHSRDGTQWLEVRVVCMGGRGTDAVRS